MKRAILRFLCSTCIVAAALSIAPAAQPGERIAPGGDLRVYGAADEQTEARAMLAHCFDGRMAQVWEARAQQLAELKTPAAWQERQGRTRARLAEMLGDFGPECRLDARVVGRLERADYTIEKLIFQSQPGYHCTANVYVPRHRPFPQPGVLFTCGHSPHGKAAPLYHEACLGLVLKGYVVLALDPMGQGERSEYFEPDTGRPIVPLTVSQHHYLSRPSWLVGRSLAGYRVRDANRAVDYLLTRPEVDPKRIAVVGNSGGGIMALLATATDPRIQVCAAAHPGGSMEETYLTGKDLAEADLLSLIAPRPCLFIVGEKSGEESMHRRKMDWMRPFYRGLGADDDRLQMVLVDGVHDMKRPKREPAYGWLNRWLGKENEGAVEPTLTPEAPDQLRCTATGFTLRDLGGVSGQKLNAACAERLEKTRARSLPKGAPAIRRALDDLREAVRARIGLRIPPKRPTPACTSRGTIAGDGFTAEKLVLDVEPGIRLPALRLEPGRGGGDGPVIVHICDEGKPIDAARPSLALELARAGRTVLTLDVRGAGETDPRDRAKLASLTKYDAQQFRFDAVAVGTAQLGTTLAAMQTLDVIRALDWLSAPGASALAGRPVFLVGEGLGGVWALMAAALDPRPAGVACVQTIPSYRWIVDAQYYDCRDYFWVPRALATFDLPDLLALVAPRPAAWIDPMDAAPAPAPPDRCRALWPWPESVYAGLDAADAFRCARTPGGDAPERAAHVLRSLDRSTR